MGVDAAARKLLRRLRRDRQALEARKLTPQPRAYSARCNAFAASASVCGSGPLDGRDELALEPTRWRRCAECVRAFAAASSRFGALCSLDCKSASMLSAGARAVST